MAIEDKNQEPEGPNRAEDKSQKKREESAPIAPPVVSEPNTPIATKCQGDACQEKGYRLAKKQYAVATITMIVLFIYTAIAAYQAYEMRKATRAAKQSADAAQKASDTADATLKSSRESFQIEQRPYLVTEVPQFVVTPVAPGKTSANITYRNIGRTPAVKIRTEISLFLYRPTKKGVPGAIGRFVTFLQSRYQDLRRKLDAAAAEQYAGLAREDVAPNGTRFSTGELEKDLSAAEIPELQKGDLTLFFIGTARYTDAYSGSYETESCYIYFGTNPTVWHICDSHNTIK